MAKALAIQLYNVQHNKQKVLYNAHFVHRHYILEVCVRFKCICMYVMILSNSYVMNAMIEAPNFDRMDLSLNVYNYDEQ